jgi:hypothetical protein
MRQGSFMKLYFVYVGYYETEIGICELHTSFMVAAENAIEAKKTMLAKPIFQEKKMHIDGIEEINEVDGYQVTLSKATSETASSQVYDYKAVKKLD